MAFPLFSNLRAFWRDNVLPEETMATAPGMRPVDARLLHELNGQVPTPSQTEEFQYFFDDLKEATGVETLLPMSPSGKRLRNSDLVSLSPVHSDVVCSIFCKFFGHEGWKENPAAMKEAWQGIPWELKKLSFEGRDNDDKLIVSDTAASIYKNAYGSLLSAGYGRAEVGSNVYDLSEVRAAVA